MHQSDLFVVEIKKVRCLLYTFLRGFDEPLFFSVVVTEYPDPLALQATQGPQGEGRDKITRMQHQFYLIPVQEIYGRLRLEEIIVGIG